MIQLADIRIACEPHVRDSAPARNTEPLGESNYSTPLSLRFRRVWQPRDFPVRVIGRSLKRKRRSRRKAAHRGADGRARAEFSGGRWV